MADMTNNNVPGQGVEFAGAPTQAQHDAEKAEVQLVMKLWETGKQARKDIEKDWDTRWDFYKGKQWEGGVKKPVINIIRATIQGTLPIMTDSRPGFNAVAKEPSDYQFASTLSSVVESWWDNAERGLDHTLVECLTDSQIYDCGIGKVWWDEEADNGIGNIAFDAVSPKDIWVNPEATDFNKNCTWVIHRTYKTVGCLKRKFSGKNIHADSKKDEDTDKSISTEVTLVSPTDQKWPVPSTGNSSESDSRDMVEVLEAWLDSEEMEDYREEKEGKVEEGQKRKYPNGKLITILPNQKMLLQSIESPYKHGKKPFIRFVDTIVPRKFWGEGEAEPLMDIQKIINRVWANIISYSTLMANPIWKNERDSGVDSADITNDVALVIECDPGKINSIIRDIPPGMQAGILDLINQAMRLTEMISGISDVTQGRRPQGIQAGIAIDSLQEAAQTRIRLKERSLQISLSQLGSQVIQLMMQYYKSPRVARITGRDDWPEFFEYFIDETPEGYVMNKKGFAPNPEQGGYVPENGYQQSGPSKGIFDIKVQSGTSLPFAKTERMNLAMKLRGGGDLSREGLYDAIEWPDAQKELQRMAEQDQAQAQAQAQQQAMKGA